MDLRTSLIKLATAHPELRKHLVPLIRTATQRIWVERGLLIEMRNPVMEARALMRYDEADIIAELEYVLYDELNGNKPVTGSWKGQGTIVKRGAHHYLVMGDPVRQATLFEYRIADEPTPESSKRFDAVAAGIKAAIGDFKVARRQVSKGEDWLRGYDEALKFRKSVDRGLANEHS